MCLAVPGKVISIEANEAVVEILDARRVVAMDLLPDARVGDFILVHAGLAIETIDAEEARRTIELIRDINRLAEGADA